MERGVFWRCPPPTPPPRRARRGRETREIGGERKCYPKQGRGRMLKVRGTGGNARGEVVFSKNGVCYTRK